MLLPFEAGTVRVTSPYGERWLNGELVSHYGVDLVCDNPNVCAAVAGTVIYSRQLPKYLEDGTLNPNATWQWGNYVCIGGVDGRTYYYCHLSSRAIMAGEFVNAGQRIGVMGNTGYSFGAHLHFEVREGYTYLDPCKLLGISNTVGYTQPVKREGGYMSDNDIKALIEADNIPEWGVEAITWYAKKGYLKGTGSSFGLSAEMLRILVIGYRIIKDNEADGK